MAERANGGIFRGNYFDSQDRGICVSLSKETPMTIKEKGAIFLDSEDSRYSEDSILSVSSNICFSTQTGFILSYFKDWTSA